MDRLLPLATDIAARLTASGQTVGVAESSTGGLVSAALLAIPGASAYFLGGGVIYTKPARRALLGIDDAAMAGIRSSTEPYAALLAQTVRARLGADWGLAETGVAGPSGNGHGGQPGQTCLAIAGASTTHTMTLDTGSADRPDNMRVFAHALLSLFVTGLPRSG